MRILAIDHGTRSGYSVFEGASYFTSGIIQLEDVTALEQAYKEFYVLFAGHRPNYLVTEKINVSGTKFGGDNVVKLARLQGVIVMLAQAFNCKVLEVNPMSMKKYITGSGRAEKQDVALHVANRWRLEHKDICVPEYYKRKQGIKSYQADESDAIALGTYALDCLV